jgi:hypothetical protein
MTTQGPTQQHTPYPPLRPQQQSGRNVAGHQDTSGHGGHGWMMLICCVPMVAIVVLLAFTGVAGSGAILGALLCMGMMAAMMVMMPGDHRHH